jgi:hypothetical protein
MSQWEASNDWEGAGSPKAGANDDFDFRAPGPSQAFAPLKEQHNDGYYAGGGDQDAYAGNDTCRK